MKRLSHGKRFENFLEVWALLPARHQVVIMVIDGRVVVYHRAVRAVYSADYEAGRRLLAGARFMSRNRAFLVIKGKRR